MTQDEGEYMSGLKKKADDWLAKNNGLTTIIFLAIVIAPIAWLVVFGERTSDRKATASSSSTVSAPTPGLAVVNVTTPASTSAGELTTNQKRELTVFGLRAMGMQASLGDVKKTLSRAEIEKMIAAGINLNGHLCAKITAIRPLKVKSTYEVTCIAYRDGSARKAYLLDPLKGIASEM